MNELFLKLIFFKKAKKKVEDNILLRNTKKNNVN